MSFNNVLRISKKSLWVNARPGAIADILTCRFCEKTSTPLKIDTLIFYETMVKIFKKCYFPESV